MLQTLTRRLFSKRPISAVGRGATTHMRLTGDKLICLVLCHWTAQYYRGAAQKRSHRALASALKRRAHTGWALRIDPQGHRIQSGRTNKRRGRQGNLRNPWIKTIHLVGGCNYVKSHSGSSSPHLFLEISTEEGIVAIKMMWERRQLKLI